MKTLFAFLIALLCTAAQAQLQVQRLDGYVVAFSWGELDPALGGRRVFLVTEGLKPE